MRHVAFALSSLALGSLFAASSAQANETVNVGVCVSWPGYAMLEVAKE